MTFIILSATVNIPMFQQHIYLFTFLKKNNTWLQNEETYTIDYLQWYDRRKEFW